MTKDEIKFKCIELAQDDLRGVFPNGIPQEATTEDMILGHAQKHLNIFLKLNFSINPVDKSELTIDTPLNASDDFKS